MFWINYGDGKNQSFNIWFKEFIVNVIVQVFHAVVYVLITGAGIRIYIERGGQTFLFTVLCVLFLFEGEKILRGIFNMKSQANSIGDLAASGAIVMGMAKNAGNLFKRNNADNDNSEDKKDAENAEKRNKNRRNKSKEDADAAIAAFDEKPEGESSFGEYLGEANEPEGVSTPKFDGQKAQDAVLATAMKRRLKKGLATRAVNGVAGAAGATLLATRAIADGKTNPGEALGAISAGKTLGQTLASPISFATNKAEQAIRGASVARAIRAGEFDSVTGLDAISNGEAADFMNTTDYENKMDSQQAIYRNALIAYEKAAARGGKSRGEIAYYNYLEKNLKNN